MRKVIALVGIMLASVLLAACAPATEFKSEADERLYRSIEQGENLAEVMQSVADGASIDKLKRGRLVSLNMVEFAALSGRTEVAEWLIANGADVNYKTSIMGETLLMSMAAAGQYKLCELLLGKGADVNTKDRLSDTALEYALKASGNVPEIEIDRLVTLFIENGAVVRRETLDAALSGYTGKGDGDCRYGIVRKIALALHENGGKTRLRPALEAAISGDGDNVLKLLDAGGVSTSDNKQILFYTAAFGSEATLKRLEDKGLDIRSTDKDGNTLLMLAARYGNIETIKYLLGKNQDFYTKNNFGKTVIDAAAESGNKELITLIEANMPSRETGAFGGTCGCTCCEC